MPWRAAGVGRPAFQFDAAGGAPALRDQALVAPWTPLWSPARGRGIGREIARLLATRGYAVLVTDMNEDAARETAEMLGERAWPMATTSATPTAIASVAAAAAERGPLEVWVNNAGILRTTKAWEHTDEEVRVIVEANLLGVLWGSRAAVEAMRGTRRRHREHGLDVVVRPGPGTGRLRRDQARGAAASPSRSRATSTTRGIPIRTHAICPDGVDTGMVRERQGRTTPRSSSPLPAC